MEHHWESKDLFEVLLDTAVSKIYTLEEVVNIAYSLGKEHGEAIKTKQMEKNNVNSVPVYHPTPSNKPYARNGRASSSSSHASSSSQPTAQPPSHKPATSSSQQPPLINKLTQNAYMGVDFIGISSSEAHDLLSMPYQSTLRLPTLDRSLPLGTYHTSEDAAMAHDRALIRALGPSQCTDSMLNNPMVFYAKDPLELFEQFDPVLKRGLFGTNWTGPKDVDFSFLVVQAPMKRPRL